MSELELAPDLYIQMTPAGAYQALSSPITDKSRRFLQRVLQRPTRPSASKEVLATLMESDDYAKNLELLYHCQKLGWLHGTGSSIQAPSEALEEILPGLLSAISETDKVLLADEQGFYLSSSGFPHETAEELSALSAELATVHARRTGVLANNLGLASHAWAIVDAYGFSQIGFWPLFIGKHRFVIAIAGIPHFNRNEFVTLAWALSIRYCEK